MASYSVQSVGSSPKIMSMMKSIAFEVVPLSEARRVHEGERPVTRDWSAHRAVVQEETLLPATSAWIAQLPAGTRPLHLAQRFARIANRMAALWEEPVRCRRYLDELMISSRPGRQGFPPAIAAEIGKLMLLYGALHPPQRSWS